MANAARVQQPSRGSTKPVAIIRVPRLKQVPTTQAVAASDGLDAFAAESEMARIPAEPGAAPAGNSRQMLWAVLGIGLVGAIAAAAPVVVKSDFMRFDWIKSAVAATPAPASLTLRTVPEGATIQINGQSHGVSPLSIQLAPGNYKVQVASPTGQQRELDLTLEPGQSLVQQIEWAGAAPAPVVSTGGLQVQTDPPGQAVFLDDVRRGSSPLTIANLAPGDHRLLVTSDAGSYRRTVAIKAGETTTVVVAPQVPAVAAGWLRVASPIVLQLRSRGDLIGNSETDRVMLPTGEHDIELVNESLGFSRTQRVSIASGRTAEIKIAVPNGRLSINAVPWAEVWINGEALGQTPLANITRPIGTYRVTLRHPQFGERQATVTVSSRETARLGVDMRQPQ